MHSHRYVVRGRPPCLHHPRHAHDGRRVGGAPVKLGDGRRHLLAVATPSPTTASAIRSSVKGGISFASPCRGARLRHRHANILEPGSLKDLRERRSEIGVTTAAANGLAIQLDVSIMRAARRVPKAAGEVDVLGDHHATRFHAPGYRRDYLGGIGDMREQAAGAVPVTRKGGFHNATQKSHRQLGHRWKSCRRRSRRQHRHRHLRRPARALMDSASSGSASTRSRPCVGRPPTTQASSPEANSDITSRVANSDPSGQWPKWPFSLKSRKSDPRRADFGVRRAHPIRLGHPSAAVRPTAGDAYESVFCGLQDQLFTTSGSLVFQQLNAVSKSSFSDPTAVSRYGLVRRPTTT
ncbi:MAG: hypothetical protein QOC63_5193 [Mycobacterium sp.]|nr:hypothetical protein [Mycobacterium sp.]